MRSKLAAVALLVTLTGSSCSGADEESANEQQQASEGAPAEPQVPAAPESAESTPEPEPPPKPKALSVGDMWVGENTKFRLIKVEDSYTRPGEVSTQEASDSQRWLGYRVEACVNDDAWGKFWLYWDDWSAKAANNALYTASASAYEDYRLPRMPAEVKLAAGQCINGWMVMALPSKVRLRTLEFAFGKGAVWEL